MVNTADFYKHTDVDCDRSHSLGQRIMSLYSLLKLMPKSMKILVPLSSTRNLLPPMSLTPPWNVTLAMLVVTSAVAGFPSLSASSC